MRKIIIDNKPVFISEGEIDKDKTDIILKENDDNEDTIEIDLDEIRKAFSETVGDDNG